MVVFLVELVVATLGPAVYYSGEERARVESSSLHIAEAVLAALTPSQLPPVPDEG
jgi:hypothetical protein